MHTRIAGMLLIGLSVLPVAQAANARCHAQSAARVVPLVELYTAEGCSSCPPADRWLGTQVRAKAPANYLAFHVDYWDDIGWPDRFASPAYSQRQRARVAAAGGRTVYTPQVMVGGQVQADWRAPRRFDAMLEREGARTPGAALQLQLQRAGTTLSASLGAATIGAHPDAEVWLAQYIDDQQTAVRAGENRGATLHHDRVVRRTWGPWRLGATALSRAIELPDVAAARWGLTAFVQDARGRTLQSLDLPAAPCLAAR